MTSIARSWLNRLHITKPIPEPISFVGTGVAHAELGSLAKRNFAYNNPFDYTAKPCRFRFLDCQKFVNKEVISILEFQELPASCYAAISYVWRGLKPSSESPSPVINFSVEGAEDADLISSRVLRTACLAALYFECDFLWVDRLCIMQTSREDKTWQIKNMFDVYQSCRVCLVLPGGLARLANPTEVTTWIHRAWTLQESLAPPNVQVVFSWTLGSCYWQHSQSVEVTEIEPQTAAVASLEAVLSASMAHGVSSVQFNHHDNLHPGGVEGAPEKIRPRMLSDQTEAGGVHHLTTLLGALTQDAKEGRMNAVWRAALLRTSSRPVDMVFSIMGLLGVNLDPATFRPEERQRATIQLVKELMQKGLGAEWLGIAPNLRLPGGLSTVPVMPKTSVEGRAYVEAPDGDKEMSVMLGRDLRAMWWWLDGAPTGLIDDSGNLKINAKAVPVSKCQGPRDELEYAQNSHPDIVVDYATDERWSLKIPVEHAYFAVNIGQKIFYRHGFLGKVFDPNSTLLMLLERDSEEKMFGLRIIGYAWGDETLSQNWPTKEIFIHA